MNIHSSGGALIVSLNGAGDARAGGAIHFGHGVSKTVLVADGSAEARCVDADGDGVSGITRLTIGLRDIRTGETITGIISPLDGEIDASGKYVIKRLIGRPRAEGMELVMFVQR